MMKIVITALKIYELNVCDIVETKQLKIENNVITEQGQMVLTEYVLMNVRM
jgi:hypothetical protein